MRSPPHNDVFVRCDCNPSMSLPNLAALSLDESVERQWYRACGTQPAFKNWKNLDGRDKYRLLHAVAARADDDVAADGDYVTAYEQLDIDDVMSREVWSVEHVVPRSHINGRAPGAGENDPVGWIEATRTANSRRSNLPLYLWTSPDGSMAPENTKVRVDGEWHFVPPLAQRARLARKWMFIRATYDDIQAPSKAQTRHAAEIVALAQHFPIQPAERRVNEHFRSTLRWANPLLEADADRWYGDVKWRARVFSGPA